MYFYSLSLLCALGSTAHQKKEMFTDRIQNILRLHRMFISLVSVCSMERAEFRNEMKIGIRLSQPDHGRW